MKLRKLYMLVLLLVPAWSHAAPFAYVSSAGISVVDLATGTVVATASTGSAPFGVAVAPDGARVYITSVFCDSPRLPCNANVAVLDAATNRTIATLPAIFPGGVAVNAAGTRLYVANLFPQGSVDVFDLSSLARLASVQVGGAPAGVAIAATGGVYVANAAFDTVSVIDPATNTVVATLSVGQDPYGVAASPADARVYVANRTSNTVSVIDTLAKRVVQTIPVASFPAGIAVRPDGAEVYVTHIAGTQLVSVIDTASGTVSATISMGGVGVSFEPTGRRAYVTNGPDYALSVIDTASRTVVDTIPIGGPGLNPHPDTFGQFIVPAPVTYRPQAAVSPVLPVPALSWPALLSTAVALVALGAFVKRRRQSGEAEPWLGRSP